MNGHPAAAHPAAAHPAAAHPEQGLTLIEVLVALALFSLLIGAVCQGLLALPKVGRKTSEHQQAALMSKTYFEQMQSHMDSQFTMSNAAYAVGAGLPAASTRDGMTCSPTATQQETMSLPGVVAPVPAIVRVTLSCRGTHTYTFAQDYGRRP